MLLGLAGKGNLSDVPLFGGVKAESGSRGKGPLRRAPTPGDDKGGGIGALIVLVVLYE